MKEISQQEIRPCLLGILEFIDKVCKDNNIRYFLSGGTLLGAARHKGFIPWDDDIDIMMLRDDYNRLFEVCPKDSRYALLNCKNTPHFPYAYGKAIDKKTIKIEPVRKSSQLIGLDVDIFPIDSLPDDDDETEKFYLEIAKMSRRLSLQLSSYGKGASLSRTIARNIRLFLLRISEKIGITSVDKCTNKFDILAQKYNQSQTLYCGVTSISHYGIKEKNLKSNYENSVKVTFEGKSYPAPKGYCDYLAQLYGKDYMELPPIEQRQTHHHYKAYWK